MFKYDLSPRTLSGSLRARTAAGIASLTLVAALTSCSFQIGELEPINEDASAPTDAAEETDTTEQAEEEQAEDTAETEPIDDTAGLPVDPSEALAWDTETFWLSGTGDALYQIDWTAADTTTLQLTHSGSANFIVVPYDADGARLGSIANEIGVYEGSIELGEASILEGAEAIEYIHVQADGEWTLTR
ncbi:hypothetical protein DFP74_3936 [Nocardiopsis sp. Huas11]|uniref:hypothetical protein n=1 Tax=Nocardiopsis sp. Huas11 TaxID=2183912 RepID=UPI000EAC523D|nr:hypothetical protein [Nocardiopsis sp. Huas11]RKS08240.1 hypothetical protein DFP74_3936 [Nocardiopsis sp. Huas11]